MDPKLWFAPENLQLCSLSPGAPWSWMHSASHWEWSPHPCQNRAVKHRALAEQGTISTHCGTWQKGEVLHRAEGAVAPGGKDLMLGCSSVEQQNYLHPFQGLAITNHGHELWPTLDNEQQDGHGNTHFGGVYKQHFTCVISSCWEAQKLKWKRL